MRMEMKHPSLPSPRWFRMTASASLQIFKNLSGQGGDQGAIGTEKG